MSGSGERVAALRKRAGLTQAQLASRLHRSVSWVQKVEQGARRLSDLTLIGELAEALGVPVSELLDGADVELAPGTMRAEDLQRTAFLQGLGVLNLAAERYPTMDRPGRVDAELVAALTEGTTELERLYGRLTPVALQGLVSGQLEALDTLLRGAPGRWRQELLSLAGETATLAGWIAADRGNDDRALAHFDAAIRAAVDAGDNPLARYAMASATTVPTFRERSQRTVVDVLAQDARGVPAGAATPATAAWIDTLVADAHASLGDTDAALHALAHAEETFGPEDRLLARPRVPFFDRGRLAGEHGIIRLRLGTSRPDVTARYLTTALVESPPEAKIRARFLTALAAVHAEAGDVGTACAYAADAYDIAVTTGTLRSGEQVRRLRAGALARHATDPAVRALDDRLDQGPI